MLCCRLRKVLPDIISSNQSAFVVGRISIVQNILIWQDLIRLYNRKSTTKSCLIKIDLRKAYDSVEWDFVEEMLHGLNFPHKFIGVCDNYTVQYCFEWRSVWMHSRKKRAKARWSNIPIAICNLYGNTSQG